MIGISDRYLQKRDADAKVTLLSAAGKDGKRIRLQTVRLFQEGDLLPCPSL